MKIKSHVKRGDEIVVISGTHKGKNGKVLSVDFNTGRIQVESINIVKRHLKKSQANPSGSIMEKQGTIHSSNVMLGSVYKASGRRKSNELVSS